MYHVLILQLHNNFYIFRVILTQRQMQMNKHHTVFLSVLSTSWVQGFHQRKNLINMWINCTLRNLRILTLPHFYSLSNYNNRKVIQNLYVHESYLKRKGGPPTSGHDGVKDWIYSSALHNYFCLQKERQNLWNHIFCLCFDNGQNRWQLSLSKGKLHKEAVLSHQLTAWSEIPGYSTGVWRTGDKKGGWGQQSPSVEETKLLTLRMSRQLEFAGHRTSKSCTRANFRDLQRVASLSVYCVHMCKETTRSQVENHEKEAGRVLLPYKRLCLSSWGKKS